MKDIVTLYGAFWCPDCDLRAGSTRRVASAAGEGAAAALAIRDHLARNARLRIIESLDTSDTGQAPAIRIAV